MSGQETRTPEITDEIVEGYFDKFAALAARVKGLEGVQKMRGLPRSPYDSLVLKEINRYASELGITGCYGSVEEFLVLVSVAREAQDS